MPARLSAVLLGSAAFAMLITGCDIRAHGDKGEETASISIGNGSDDGGNSSSPRGLSIQAPGFSAKLDIPNLDLGSGAMRIEDMKIYPGSKIAGMNVVGDGDSDEGQGSVDMRFRAPAGADQIVAWYRDQAQKTGWTIVPPAAGHQFEATKEGDHGPTRFALQVAADGGGSDGHLLVTGR